MNNGVMAQIDRWRLVRRGLRRRAELRCTGFWAVRCEQHLARSGFTLIEVILAVSLFALSVVVLAASYINILNSLEAVKAEISLEQELAFVRSQVLLEPELESVEEGGEVPTASLGLATWRATVTPTTVADLFRVDLEIELAGGDDFAEPRTVRQTLHVLRPGWSDPVERDELRAASRERIEEAKRFRPL